MIISAKAVIPALLSIVASCQAGASAQWQRILVSGKGADTDMPSPHTLSYFIANPYLRDDANDLCGPCTPDGKATSAREYSIRSVVKPVGALAGYRILDALYYVGTRENPNENDAKWKFILIQVGPDRYREIYHLQAFYTAASLKPSRIIQSGSESVLATTDSDTGNGDACWEGYWWFDRAGPHSLDFSHLQAAIKARLPENTRFTMACSSLDLESQRVQSGVQKSDAPCHTCDWIGELTARFRLVGPIVEPATISFKP